MNTLILAWGWTLHFISFRMSDLGMWLYDRGGALEEYSNRLIWKGRGE